MSLDHDHSNLLRILHDTSGDLLGPNAREALVVVMAHVERLEAVERAARAYIEATSRGGVRALILHDKASYEANVALKTALGLDTSWPPVETKPAPTQWAIRAKGHDKSEKRDFDTLRTSAHRLDAQGMRGDVITYGTEVEAEAESQILRARYPDATFTVEPYDK